MELILTKSDSVLINLNWLIEGKMFFVVSVFGILILLSSKDIGPSKTLIIISSELIDSYLFNWGLKNVNSTEFIGYFPWNWGTNV